MPSRIGPRLPGLMTALALLAGCAATSPERVPAQRSAPRDQTGKRLLVSGVRSVIPYFGWLRRLTGADRRQRLAQASFTAGAVRRGYLKGLGERLGCAPPAAPTNPP